MKVLSLLKKPITALAISFMVAMLASGAGAAEIILSENFDAVADGSLPAGFTVIDGTWEVREGKLVGKSASSSVQSRVVFGDASWSNYEISATMAFLAVDSPTRWTAINHRVQGAGGPPYSLFTLRQGATANNGLEMAYRTPDSKWAVYYTKAWHKSLALNEPHQLRLVAYGSSAYYFLNDKLVLQADDILKESQGRIGLHVNGATVTYDDIVVKRIDADDFAAILAANASPEEEASELLPPKTNIPRAPTVIAHRGASGVAPENTLAAFAKATEMGSDLIELDVQRSKDGQLIVIHDNTVNRTAKGAFTGSVSSLTLDQLRTLDAGSWKGTAYAEERLSTLEEVLSAFRGKASFLIEMKATGIEEQVAEAIKNTGMKSNVVVQSFNAASIGRFREVAPHIPAGVLFSNSSLADPIAKAQAMLDQVLQTNASFAAVAHGAVTPEFVRYLKSRGISVFVWTVDSIAVMRKMIDAGVDGIITNYPDRLQSLLQSEYDPRAWRIDVASPKPYRVAEGSIPLIVRVSAPKGTTFDQMQIKLDEKLIFTGTDEPWAESIDTLALADGNHELLVSIITTDGQTIEEKSVFTVNNLWKTKDSLEPPLAASWFGVVDRSLTSSESDGWVFETKNALDFHGDADRKRRSANTNEYLIWEAKNLTNFSITVFCKEAHIGPAVEVSASEDGEKWHVLPFNVLITDLESSDWLKLVLEGEGPGYGASRWLKLTLKQGPIAAEELQVGLVELTGLK